MPDERRPFTIQLNDVMGIVCLLRTPMPVLVTEYIRDNDDEGQPERYVPKNQTYRTCVAPTNQASVSV